MPTVHSFLSSKLTEGNLRVCDMDTYTPFLWGTISIGLVQYKFFVLLHFLVSPSF